MPKLLRPSLTRGIKLLKESVFDNALSLAAGWMSDVTKMVEIDQRDPTKATTYLSWVLPVFDHTHSDAVTASGPATLPFPLPPFQEFFASDWKVAPTTPRLTLTSVQFGFDQKGEGAVVTAHSHAAGVDSLDYDQIANLKFKLFVDEKRPNIMESASAEWSYVPTRQVVSIEVDGTAFMDKFNRPNPLLVKVNKQLNPYRTYVIRMDVQGLQSGGEEWDLPGFQVTLGIEHPNVERDKGANIQNLPDDSSSRSASTVNLSVPSGGDKIVADGSSGIVGNLDLIEAEFVKKLTGGFYKDGGVPVSEHILEDAGYEIIPVPMFSRMTNLNEVAAADAPKMPGALIAPSTGKVGDRMWVFLNYPLVVHHVVAVISYATNDPFAGGKHPTAGSFVNEIDVLIGTGHKADFAAYQSIATQTWTPATKATKLIDRIKEFQGTIRSSDGWTHELMHVPLVGAGGTGYYAQGHPVYCGKASSKYTARQDIAGGAPLTLGLEQFIECRWIMYDNNLGLTGPGGGGSSTNDADQLVGHDGHCLLLYCKKAMMGGVHDVRV